MIETTSKERLDKAEKRSHLLRAGLEQAANALGIECSGWGDSMIVWAVLYRVGAIEEPV